MPDIFREGWAHTTKGWSTDSLKVWAARAAQIRAEFKRDLRLSRVFAAKLASLTEDRDA